MIKRYVVICLATVLTGQASAQSDSVDTTQLRLAADTLDAMGGKPI